MYSTYLLYTNMKTSACTNSPIAVTLRVIGGKWKPLILWLLKDKTLRFSELFRQSEGITQKMLTQQLREMEADGLVKRKIFPEIPPRVEYSLTEYGATLFPVLESMCAWGEKHVQLK